MTSTLIPYDIVYCTSQDADHPISNLVGCDPENAEDSLETLGSGWQSTANGKFPQTIVLRFPGVVWLHQLRILSHEAKIASRVEVRVFKLKRGAPVDEASAALEDPPSFRAARFTKLGTVDFNSNERSNHKAKERKTIHLKTEAYFVKLLFDQPHANSLNPLRQVGLYAIECIGYIVTPVRRHVDKAVNYVELPSTANASSLVSSSNVSSAHVATSNDDGLSLSRPSGSQGTASAANAVGGRQQGNENHVPTPAQQSKAFVSSQPVVQASASPLAPPQQSDGDFLGSSADIHPFRSLRILEFEEFFLRRSEELLSLKEQAIAVEDFETATECRDKLTRLNERSRSIYKLEQEKVQAIIEEDFDQAKEMRDLMNATVEQAFAEAKLPTPGLQPSSVPFNGVNDNGADDGDDAEDAESVIHFEEEEQRPSRASGMEDYKAAADHVREADIPTLHRARGSTSSTGTRFSESGPVAALSDTNMSFEERRAVGGGDEKSLQAFPRNDGVIDELQVSRVDPGEVFLHLRDIPNEEDGCERLVSSAILAATGENENGTVVFADVSLDLRQLLACIGQFPTACLVSRRFKLREAALTVLTEAMHDHYLASAAHVEDAVLRFLDYNGVGLQDTIPNVVFASCTFVRMALFDECGVLADVSPQVAALVPRLLTRAADPLPRVREEAVTTLTLYTKTSNVPLSPFIAAILADPIDKERRKIPITNPRAQLARLTALQILLDSERAHSLAENSTSSIINKLLIPAVNHPNVDVRDAGTNVFRKLIDTVGVTLREKDLAKVNNSAIKDALISGKRQRRTQV